MELSRGDKQKQTNWPKSATRAKVYAKSVPICLEFDRRIAAGDVGLMNEATLKLRARNCDTDALRKLLQKKTNQEMQKADTDEKNAREIAGLKKRKRELREKNEGNLMWSVADILEDNDIREKLMAHGDEEALMENAASEKRLRKFHGLDSDED